jgi:hypothetical protein
MTEDLNEQWRRLSEHYAQMLDGELVRLAGQYDDLTETARPVLRDEMLKRGLGDPTKPEEIQQAQGRLRFTRGMEIAGDTPDAEDAEDGDGPHEYTWMTQLCECETREQAWQIIEVLDRAEIQNWIRLPEHGVTGSPYYLIKVAADQIEEARAIVAQPIPQDVVDESKIEEPDFSVPRCPRCGAEDPTLRPQEELKIGDPKPEMSSWVNSWHCEGCGHEWSDRVAAS